MNVIFIGFIIQLKQKYGFPGAVAGLCLIVAVGIYYNRAEVKQWYEYGCNIGTYKKELKKQKQEEDVNDRID